MPFDPDLSRNVAHKKYRKAQEVAKKSNGKVSVEDAFSQLRFNNDWQYGDPTYQEVQDNWDYYKSQLNEPEVDYKAVYQIPNATPVDNDEEDNESEMKKVSDSMFARLSQEKKNKAEENSEEPDQAIQEQPDLNPTVEVDNSQAAKQLSDEERKLWEAYQAEQDRKLFNAQQAVENQLASQYAMAGVNPYEDPLYLQQAQEARTIDEIPYFIGEVARRTTDENGNVRNPLTWNMGWTNQQLTSPAARAIYDYHFNQWDENGAPKNKVKRTWDRGGASTSEKLFAGQQEYANQLASQYAMAGVNPYDDALFTQQSQENITADEIPSLTEWWKNPVVDKYAIDNGESPESRESIYMTGEQYLRYVNDFGLPGRPSEEIDPNAIYSKQEEQDKYGFIPYITSTESLDDFGNTASINAVNNAFNDLTNLRRNLTDYSINYDGNEFSGKDFNDAYNLWVNKVTNQDADVFTDASQATENSVPLTLTMQDSVTGETVYAPTADYMTPDGEINVEQDPNGGYMIDFHTGDPNDNWHFDDVEDINNSIGYEFAGDEHPVTAWQNIDPFVIDGKEIRADKAMSLYDNQEDFVDYGLLGRPNAEDPFGADKVVPWFVDIALGSAPLFFAPTAAVQAIGNTQQNMQGFRAGHNEDGEYQLLSENPTHEQQLMTSTGSAILPATERLWGSIGKAGRVFGDMPGSKALARKFPDVAEHPLGIWAQGALGEGLEEIPGNIVEEMQGAGTFGDYFANDLYIHHYDEDGNPVYTTLEANPDNPDEEYTPAYDAQGKRLRDQNTSLPDRAWNFVEEWPLSVLGGAALGGTIGALPVPGNEAWGALPGYLERREERKKLGSNIEIPDEVLERTRKQGW